MNCIDVIPILGAFLDRELSLTEDAEVRAHLAHCVFCRSHYDSLYALQSMVRRESPYSAAGSLRQRIEDALPVAKPAKRFHFQFGAFGLGVACAAIAFVIFGIFNRTTPRLEAELVASHVRSLMPGHLIDIASSNRHTVKPWFAGKVNVSPSPWDLKTSGFPLLGGRLDFIDSTPTAVLVYGHNEHFIDVFVFPNAQGFGIGNDDRQGFHIVSWHKGDLLLVAISDVDLHELNRFVAAYHEADSANSHE